MDGDVGDKLKTLEDLCRQRRIPLTTQRHMVLEVLLQRYDHPTADEIFEVVRERSRRTLRRTVYRVLDTLAELGLIRRVHHPGPTTRFDAEDT